MSASVYINVTPEWVPRLVVKVQTGVKSHESLARISHFSLVSVKFKIGVRLYSGISVLELWFYTNHVGSILLFTFVNYNFRLNMWSTL